MSQQALARQGAAASPQLGPPPVSFGEMKNIAQVMVQSGYFGSNSLAQAFVKCLFGHDLGIGPVQAMMNVHVIEGKPTLSAVLIASFVQDSGRFNFRVLERSDNACSIEFFERKDDGEWESIGTSTFTIQDAATAKLTNRANWTTYRKSMLWARAMTHGVRAFCPSVLKGHPVYSPDELSENWAVGSGGEAVQTAPDRETIEAAPIPEAPTVSAAPVEASRELATASQQRKLHALAAKANLNDDERRLVTREVDPESMGHSNRVGKDAVTLVCDAFEALAHPDSRDTTREIFHLDPIIDA